MRASPPSDDTDVSLVGTLRSARLRSAIQTPSSTTAQHTAAAIAKTLGVSRTTVYRHLTHTGG